MPGLPGDEAQAGADPGGPRPEGGGVSLDFNGKKPGRGAYLCPDPACLKRVRKSRALERAFGQPIPEAVYDALEAEMEGGGTDG